MTQMIRNIMRHFGPSILGIPRASAIMGLAAGLFTGLAIATTGAWAAAILGAVAITVAVSFPTMLLLERQEAILQESRDLWALSGVMLGGPPWPTPGGWALGAGALNFLVQEVNRRDFNTVVELGPGASSVVLGRLPGLDLYGLEHDERFKGLVEANLAQHGHDGNRIVLAPLQPTPLGNRTVSWYDRAALADLPDSIDVLVVDGPPNWQGAGNRAPAWPLLKDRMAPGSIVLVDDTHRPDERAMALSWSGDGLTVLHDAGEFIAMEVA